ncbi:MAG: cytochrome c biogenesis protein CcdA, partial [Armatimonadota bacterium]
MFESIGAVISEATILAYLLVLAAGVVTSLGPCNLAMVPVIVAYIGGSSEIPRGRAVVMSSLFALGSAVTFTALGVAAALVGGMFGTAHSVLYYLVAAVCIAVGLSMLGAINLSFPQFSAGGIAGKIKQGFLGAFLLGLILGIAGSQCGTPALVAILSVAMAKGKIAYGAALLFLYGIGRGVPIVIAGASAGAIVRSEKLAKWS